MAATKHRFGPFSPCAALQAAHTGCVQRPSDFHRHWIRPQRNSRETCKQQPGPPMGTHMNAKEGLVVPACWQRRVISNSKRSDCAKKRCFLSGSLQIHRRSCSKHLLPMKSWVSDVSAATTRSCQAHRLDTDPGYI